MKQPMKALTGLVLAVLLLLTFTVGALADGRVTYDGDARTFIFAPGSAYSPTDLFTETKGMMPGDRITQKVTIDNKIEKNVKIKIYLRSLGAEDGSADFLSRLALTVKQDGGSELFAAPADRTAQLTDWVCLGTVYSGGKIDLDLTLDVPLDLDDRFQDAVGYLDWQFRVEELPVDPDDPKPPKTGDTFDPAPWLIAAGGSVLAIVILLTARRKTGKKAGHAK